MYDDGSLRDLYGFIGFEGIEVEAFYVKYVLPQAEKFTIKELQCHLCFIKINSTVFENLLNHLKQLCFMEKTDGRRYTASSFYDTTVELIQVMHNNDDFPTGPYVADDWRQFLVKLGLITDVTADMCVDYAESIASGKFDAATCSPALVKHISRHEKPKELFLAVRNIAFLPKEDISPDLAVLAAGVAHNDLVSYDTATDKNHAILSWTVLPILHDCAKPADENCDVILKPSVEHVQQHMINLHSVHADKLTSSTDTVIKSLQCVYSSCLAYVTNPVNPVLINDALCELFTKIPVVITDRGRFVKASKVVEKEAAWDGLEPYICKIPLEFGAQSPILRRLGMTDRVTLEQVVTSLSDLHKTSAGEVLGPNQAKTAMMLSFKLFRLLEHTDDAQVAISELHLLTQQKTMRVSNEVFIVDNNSVAKQPFAQSLPLIATSESR